MDNQSSTTDVNNETEVLEEPQGDTKPEEEEIVEEEEPEHEEKIPYSRFKEKVDETNTLKGMVNTLSNLVAQNQGRQIIDKEFEWPEDITPEGRKAIEKFYKTQMAGATKQVDEILGAVLDKLDKVEATSKIPGIEKHLDKIDALRHEYSQSGVYLTREKAFKLLKADGKIKDDSKSPGKKIVVKKTDVKVSSEKTNNNLTTQKATVKKDPKLMSEQELDQWMDGKSF